MIRVIRDGATKPATGVKMAGRVRYRGRTYPPGCWVVSGKHGGVYTQGQIFELFHILDAGQDRSELLGGRRPSAR